MNIIKGICVLLIRFFKFLYNNEVLRFAILALIILALLLLAAKAFYVKAICKSTFDEYKKFKIERRHFILDQKLGGKKDCKWIRLRFYMLDKKEKRLIKRLERTQTQLDNNYDLLDKYAIKTVWFKDISPSKENINEGN